MINRLNFYPANLHPELPQELLLGQAGKRSPVFFMYAGADRYTVSMFLEPHSGHGMLRSVFSAIVALILDVVLQSLHFKS